MLFKELKELFIIKPILKIYTLSLLIVVKINICYRPSVISVTVTKGGHPRGSKLYRTSKTIGRGVTELRKKFST